jgi:hypothetical protein
MNCDAVHKHLLGCERPDRPSAEASAHLADCGPCRDWQLRLLHVERAAAQLPVPPAESARSALVRRLLAGRGPGRPARSAERLKVVSSTPAANGRPARRPSIAMVVGSWIMDPYASPRRRVAAGLVAGVAAALLLFLTGWLIRDAGRGPAPRDPGSQETPADRLLADLNRHNIKAIKSVGRKTPPGERLRAMADAAEELRDRARAHGLAADELIALAQLYGRVVNEEVVKGAEALPAEERPILKPIAEGLERAYSDWAQKSQQTGLSDPEKKALQECATAAADASAGLKKLYAA